MEGEDVPMNAASSSGFRVPPECPYQSVSFSREPPCKAVRVSRDFPSRLESRCPVDDLADEQLLEILGNLHLIDLARISLVSTRLRRLSMQVKVIENLGLNRLPIKDLISALPGVLANATVLYLASPVSDDLAAAEMDLLRRGVTCQKPNVVVETDSGTYWQGKEIYWEDLPCQLVDKLSPFLGPNLTTLVLRVVQVRKHCLGTVRVITDLAMKCPLLESLDIHWSSLEREEDEEHQVYWRAGEANGVAGPSDGRRRFNVDQWIGNEEEAPAVEPVEEEVWEYRRIRRVGDPEGRECEIHGDVAPEGEAVASVVEAEGEEDVHMGLTGGIVEVARSHKDAVDDLLVDSRLAEKQCREEDNVVEDEMDAKNGGTETREADTISLPIETSEPVAPMDIDVDIDIGTIRTNGHCVPAVSTGEGGNGMLKNFSRERLDVVKEGEVNVADEKGLDTLKGVDETEANTHVEDLTRPTLKENDLEKNDGEAGERLLQGINQPSHVNEDSGQHSLSEKGVETGQVLIDYVRNIEMAKAIKLNTRSIQAGECSDVAVGSALEAQDQEVEAVEEGQEHQELQELQDQELNMAEQCRNLDERTNIPLRPGFQQQNHREESSEGAQALFQGQEASEEDSDSEEEEWVEDDDTEVDDHGARDEDPHTRLLAAGLLASRVALVLQNCHQLRKLKVEGLLFSGLFKGHDKLERLEGSFVFEFQNVVKVVNKMVSSFPALRILKLVTQFHTLGHEEELVEPGAMLFMEGAPGCRLEDLNVEGFRVPEFLCLSFPELTRLKLHRGILGSNIPHCRKLLLQCQKLTNLDLDVPIDTESIEELAKTCPNLCIVKLRHSPRQVYFRDTWKSLEELYLGGMGDNYGAQYVYLNSPRVRRAEVILGVSMTEELVVDCPLLETLKVLNFTLVRAVCSFHCPSLQSLSLGGVDPGPLEKIGRGCPNLKTLDVCCQKSAHVSLGREFRKLQVATVAGLEVCQTFQVSCPTLESLTVFYTWLKAEPPSVDIWAPRLTELDFKAGTSKMEIAVPCRILAPLLTKLSLPFAVTDIKSFGSSCPNLVSLRVKYVADGSIFLDSAFKHLRTLKIGEVNCKPGYSSTSTPPLLYLDIRCPQLTTLTCGSVVGPTNRKGRFDSFNLGVSRGIQRFCRLECPRLEVLDLGFYPLGAIDSIAIGCPSLRVLRIVGCIEEWASPSQQPALQPLDVVSEKATAFVPGEVKSGIHDNDGHSPRMDVFSQLQERVEKERNTLWISQEKAADKKYDNFCLKVGPQFSKLAYFTVKITGPQVIPRGNHECPLCEFPEVCSGCDFEGCGSMAWEHGRSSMDRVGPWLGLEEGGGGVRQGIQVFLAEYRQHMPEGPSGVLQRIWDSGRNLSDEEQSLSRKEESSSEEDGDDRHFGENVRDKEIIVDVHLQCPLLKEAALCFQFGKIQNVNLICPTLASFVLAHGNGKGSMRMAKNTSRDVSREVGDRVGMEELSRKEQRMETVGQGDVYGSVLATATGTIPDKEGNTQVRQGKDEVNWRSNREVQRHILPTKCLLLPLKTMVGARHRQSEVEGLPSGNANGQSDGHFEDELGVLNEEIVHKEQKVSGCFGKREETEINALELEWQPKLSMHCPKLVTFRWVNMGLDSCPVLVTNTQLSLEDVEVLSTQQSKRFSMVPDMGVEAVSDVRAMEKTPCFPSAPSLFSVMLPSLSFGVASHCLRELELTKCCQASLFPDQNSTGFNWGQLVFGPEWASLQKLHLRDIAVDSAIISCPRLQTLHLSVAKLAVCRTITVRCSQLRGLYLDVGNGPTDEPCVPQITSYSKLNRLAVIGRLSERKLANLVVPMLSPGVQWAHLVSRDIRNPRLFEEKLKAMCNMRPRSSRLLVSNWLSRGFSEPSELSDTGIFHFT